MIGEKASKLQRIRVLRFDFIPYTIPIMYASDFVKDAGRSTDFIDLWSTNRHGAKRVDLETEGRGKKRRVEKYYYKEHYSGELILTIFVVNRGFGQFGVIICVYGFVNYCATVIFR